VLIHMKIDWGRRREWSGVVIEFLLLCQRSVHDNNEHKGSSRWQRCRVESDRLCG